MSSSSTPSWSHWAPCQTDRHKSDVQAHPSRTDKAREQLLFGGAKVSKSGVRAAVMKLKRSDEDMRTRHQKESSADTDQAESTDPSVQATRAAAFDRFGVLADDEQPDKAWNVRWEDCVMFRDLTDKSKRADEDKSQGQSQVRWEAKGRPEEEVNLDDQSGENGKKHAVEVNRGAW